MERDLQDLADKLGIATKFSDAGLRRQDYEIDADTLRFFVKALGYKAGNDKEIANSLRDFDNLRWQSAFENIYVMTAGQVELDVVLPTSQQDAYFDLTIKSQNDQQKVDISYEIFNDGTAKTIGKTSYTKFGIVINTPLAFGYYEVSLTVEGKKHQTTLAVAPDACYQNPALDNGKPWGYAVQLYSIKSERNWGVGDFTDLCNLVRLCKNTGASVIGLSPLNVLAHDFPENASPYSSISRLFLNPIYIDVEQMPEFLPDDKQKVATELVELRGSELIQYSKVYPLKVKVIEECFTRMKADRQKEFKAFCQAQGSDLDKLCTFQALYEHFSLTIWGGWRAWPEEYRNPYSLAVKNFVAEHKARVDFFKFMQFEADRQFNQAQKLVDELGLSIGFYRDLAVGVGQDGAELWSEPDLFIKNAGAGAPPDAFFPAGQSWGLGAFSPTNLKNRQYEPLIKILRANMKNAGVLRIDHVMSLMRLYIIPEGAGKIGTYINYNFADMLNIVALESHLNKCSIVGESIGNVPEGFLDTLAKKNIYSLSVLWAERLGAGWGDFLSPSDYPLNAFASVGTHDMAPLRMWWFGYDIEQAYHLGLIASEHDRAESYHKRELDRWKLLFALDSNGVWPEDNQRKANYLYGEGYPEGIEEAVHRFMSRCNSKVFLVQPEDILHVDKLQNMPGTDYDKHPNWRRKLPVVLEHLQGDIAFMRNISAIRKERP